MKEILVPTDFSTYAQNALDFGVQLARKAGAILTLFHVVEAPTSQSFNTLSMVGLTEMEKLFQEEGISGVEDKIISVVSRLEAQDIKVDYKLIESKSYDSISEIIAKQKTDIIIMGTKGCSGLNEIIIGSNTEKVVRLAKCPVITIPHKIELNKFKRMLFASNVHFSTKVLKVALDFQLLFGTELDILWVHTPHVIESEERVNERLKNEIEAVTNGQFAIHISKNISVKDGILSFADEIDADLIVMATHGRQGLSHLFGSNLTEGIVNHSRRPVLTQRI